MSVNGTVTIDWADGKYEFCVAKFEHALELEEKCDAGLQEIFARVSQRQWRVTDLRETIRIGLIGAGQPPSKALKLTERYVESRPWAESVPVAQVILLAALVGVPGDNELGKNQTEGTETQAEEVASSAPSSTDKEPHSASPHEMSIA